MMTTNKMFLPMLLLAPAFAQPRVLHVDPEASAVEFSLGDILHSVHGAFRVHSGSVDFDPARSTISGSIAVSAGSGRSGNDTRDRKMTTEILDAAHFSDIKFVPASYEGTIHSMGDSSIRVTGTLTIHGTAHELTVPMQVHMEAASCTVKAHFLVPYVQWGLKDPSTFLLRVAKEVQIDLKLAGPLSSPN